MLKVLNISCILVMMGLWVLMYLAGADIWHDTGSMNFWKLQGPPFTDLRVLVCCFYGLPVVFFVKILVNLFSIKRCVNE